MRPGEILMGQGGYEVMFLKTAVHVAGEDYTITCNHHNLAHKSNPDNEHAFSYFTYLYFLPYTNIFTEEG